MSQPAGPSQSAKMLVDLGATVQAWRETLCPRIELAALLSRNPTAHKWKATYRSIVLRELVSWRVVDLLAQIDVLWKHSHVLGAVILLRSAFETLAVLIYLNHKTAAVVEGREDFFDFCDVTSRLMLGSKNESTRRVAPNILTILEKCDRKYAGLMDLYADLSETAHPNYDGMCSGFSRVDEANYTTEFEDRWVDKYRMRLPAGIDLCVTMFQEEYNKVWPEEFSRLERWLVEKDEWLERSRQR